MFDEKKGGLGLPSECESAILRYLSTPDLLSLSLVSKHFRDISAAEIYRSFHIFFPDDDDPKNDNIVDSLAAGLDTFVTSDYNYCQYLREIILEALSGGPKSEQAYRSYTFDTTCGKFMNTMMALTLRKAKALETFKWDIRVELSREVFKELHRINALQNFHVRMQKGSSLCDPPKNSGPVPSSYNSPTFSPPPVINGISRTISGFKNLKSLAVLDMDDLNYLSEIQTCIKNSSTTLTSLKLSFSEDLAYKSREKSEMVVLGADDTESEDEFVQSLQVPSALQLSNPDPTLTDTWNTTKAMQRKKEKKAQEAALGEIFGIKPSDRKAGANYNHLKEGKPEKEPRGEKISSTLHKIYLNWKDEIGKHMAEHESEMSEEVEKTVFALIANTMDVLVAISSGDSKGIHTQTSNASVSDMIGVNGNEFESSSTAIPTDEDTTTELYRSHDKPSPIAKGTGKASKKGYKPEDIMDPDDIDVEEPEIGDLIEDLEIGEVDATEPKPTDETTPKEEIEDQPASETFDNTITPKLVRYSEVGSAEKVGQTSEQINFQGKTKETGTPITCANERMCEYIQRTRGLALKNLSLYLIPLKPFVLSKAIDIRVLESITLLDVGPQLLFWSILAQENRLAPLPLHKIYTDNVSLIFLKFVGELAKVEELLMLGRKPILEVEPAILDQKPVTMEQIRTLVLKKHVSTLRVLSINHAATPYKDALTPWDLTPKTAVLLCRKAKKLEELAAVMSAPVVHIINQNLSGLKNLRALDIIRFRSDDSCSWAQQEFKKFIVDSIAHYPDCKLEYIAVKGLVMRVYHRVKCCTLPKFGKSSIVKGKDKSDIQVADHAAAIQSGSGNGSVSTAQAKGLEGTTFIDVLSETGSPIQGQELNAVEGASSASEDENEYEEGFGEKGIKSLGLKIENVDGFLGHEVVGVRIFEKDVVWQSL
ncbi:hypothetical protein EYC84_002833 [Monilinia fructicola]|uniref:F-box domain-containing protein n=1 Tax=Monilinia fructicola TaxID=38448 RepID=A0A5M9JMT6_MONFR|nr:hypothetical protein EYC84_002833 [Monilinia fructicola]